MKSTLLLFLLALCACATVTHIHAAPPFTLAIVPTKSHGGTVGPSIVMAQEKPEAFHVVLTNISAEAQPVFETWNSWGYQAVSFEITLPDGKTSMLTMRDQGFSKNFPSTYLIPPGGHQVFPVKFDKAWQAKPTLPHAAEMLITLKAIYEVGETPESREKHVWTGRVESAPVKLTLRQW
jgi:hypothetical protein